MLNPNSSVCVQRIASVIALTLEHDACFSHPCLNNGSYGQGKIPSIRLSLDLILRQQEAFRTLPPRIEYYHHHEQTAITGIVLAKLCSSSFSSSFLFSFSSWLSQRISFPTPHSCIVSICAMMLVIIFFG